MIYRRWSLMTMPFALVGAAGAVALAGGFVFKDKALASVEQLCKEGEMLRRQDRARMATERQPSSS